MNAWFSGSARKALVESSNGFLLFEVGHARNVTSLSLGNAAIVSRDWLDVYVIEVEPAVHAQRESIWQELENAVNCYDALLTTSLAIDRAVKEDRRERAAIEANRLLRQDPVRDYVLGVLCSHPMPENADFVIAERIRHSAQLRYFGVIIDTVTEFKDKILAVFEAWSRIKTHVFGSAIERDYFQAEAIRASLFLSLVRRIGDERRCQHLREIVKNTRVAALRNSDEVIDTWVREANVYSFDTSWPIHPFDTTEQFSRRFTKQTSKDDSGPIYTNVSKRVPAFQRSL